MLGLLGFMGIQPDAAASATTGPDTVTDMVETSISEHPVRNLGDGECNCNGPCRRRNRRALKKLLKQLAVQYIDNVVTTAKNECDSDVLFGISDHCQNRQNTLLATFYRMVGVVGKNIGLTWQHGWYPQVGPEILKRWEWFMEAVQEVGYDTPEWWDIYDPCFSHWEYNDSNSEKFLRLREYRKCIERRGYEPPNDILTGGLRRALSGSLRTTKATRSRTSAQSESKSGVTGIAISNSTDSRSVTQRQRRLPVVLVATLVAAFGASAKLFMFCAIAKAVVGTATTIGPVVVASVIDAQNTDGASMMGCLIPGYKDEIKELGPNMEIPAKMLVTVSTNDKETDYYFPMVPQSPLFLGCRKDDRSRDLDTQMGPGSTAECNVACRGYSFFSMQAGGQCFCGNEFGGERYPTAGWAYPNCGNVCSGEDNYAGPKRYCGDGWRNAVYTTYGLSEPDENNSLAKYLGCYVDDNSRNLDNLMNSSTKQTSFWCNVECGKHGFPFFAMQDGGECRCGHHYGAGEKYKKVGDSECGNKCAGEDEVQPTRRCGAPMRNAMYQTTQVTPQYQGCYTDDRGTRDLPVARYENQNTDSCNIACAGYKYFAMQYGGECRCGNSFGNHGNYKRSDSECGVPCRGEDNVYYDGETRLCGGGHRNAVYKTYTSARAMSNRDGYPTWHGCFQDKHSYRSFEVDFGLGYNTEQCKHKCRSHWKFFALEGGERCYCSNRDLKTFLPSDRHLSDGACGSVCAGEGSLVPKRYCGAQYALAVFRTYNEE